ncbi:MAG: hypothetical protein D3913_13610, partial [Candidatus Electrothrix sp. LOE1_4_5]|nr:hypothetical protein [Candidatus Electrothrix gigas]
MCILFNFLFSKHLSFKSTSGTLLAIKGEEAARGLINAFEPYEKIMTIQPVTQKNPCEQSMLINSLI